MNRLRYLGWHPMGAIVRLRHLGWLRKLGKNCILKKNFAFWRLVWLQTVCNQLRYLGRHPRGADYRVRYLGWLRYLSLGT